MPLPVGHPYQDGLPVYEDDTIMYLDIGASNAIGAATDTLPQGYNSYRDLIYKHNDTLVGFSNPPNNQSVTTYSRLDETGSINRNSFLVPWMRETTRKKVCLVSGGQSTSGITNQITGFNSPITVSQITSLCNSARSKVGKNFSFALVNVTDGDAKFSTSTEDMGTTFDSFASNLRTATGNSNLPIIMVGLGEDTDPSTYPSWTDHREYFKNDYNGANFYFVQTDDLDPATYMESDEIHWNALGHKTIAGRILHILKSINIIPTEKTITFAGGGQSLCKQLWDSTESNSNAGIVEVKDQLETFFPKHNIEDYAGYEGGSSYVTTSTSEYWWDEVNDVRGVELQQFLDGLNADNIRPDIIFWDLANSDALYVGLASETTKSEIKATGLKIFREFWRINPRCKIMLRIPHRRTAFSNADGYQVLRDIFFEWIDENNLIYRAAEAYDLALYDAVHNTDAAIAIEAPRQGRRAGQILGATLSGSVIGMEIDSVTRSGTTVTVNLSHDGGTDFTPTSGIDGFVFHDDGSSITINSSVRTDANTITLTLASEPTGEEILYYGYNAMVGIDTSKIVKDNSSEALPLQTAKIVL